MDEHNLTLAQIEAFRGHLLAEERAPGTVEKYQRDLRAFLRWLDGRAVTQERAAEWKTELLATSHAPVTVNSMVAALNGLFGFLGWARWPPEPMASRLRSTTILPMPCAMGPSPLSRRTLIPWPKNS